MDLTQTTTDPLLFAMAFITALTVLIWRADFDSSAGTAFVERYHPLCRAVHNLANNAILSYFTYVGHCFPCFERRSVDRLQERPAPAFRAYTLKP